MGGWRGDKERRRGMLKRRRGEMGEERGDAGSGEGDEERRRWEQMRWERGAASMAHSPTPGTPRTWPCRPAAPPRSSRGRPRSRSARPAPVRPCSQHRHGGARPVAPSSPPLDSSLPFPPPEAGSRLGGDEEDASGRWALRGQWRTTTAGSAITSSQLAGSTCVPLLRNGHVHSTVFTSPCSESGRQRRHEERWRKSC